MRPKWGEDCGIACCVSAMRIGKQMQFFGARVNLAKTLLYALNGGRDELSGEQVGPRLAPITSEVLDYNEVIARLHPMMDWLARTYVNALNVIHYMHDKYCYEAIEMALHDRDILRTLACGIAGLSHAADSLSAIRYATVPGAGHARSVFVVLGGFDEVGFEPYDLELIVVHLGDNFWLPLLGKERKLLLKIDGLAVHLTRIY
jgi:formate C-acetyltransferase